MIGSWIEIIVNVFLSGVVQVAGIVLSLFFVIVFAFFLDQFNLTMTWYTRPKIIFGLFMCPCFIVMTMFLLVFNNLFENVRHLHLGFWAFAISI